MWNREFLKALVERMVRGAAVTISGGYFAGDLVFDALDVGTWTDVMSLGVGGAFGSLVLSLAGNVVSGNGPAFTRAEAVAPDAP